ncbi:MAG: hypothetical protein GC189_12610 [Alphaproteobacteria bacterium]|nr:hypothetical protein [Alphaproteobacteria bacterium]
MTWPSPARAAAFRRGEAIWLVFEANGRIDLSNIARAGRWHRDMQIINGDHAVALRIAAPPEVLIAAQSDGATWNFTLSPRAQPGGAAAPVRRDMGLAARGRIIADFGREGVVSWLQDPSVGDRIGVAMLTGPAKGVAQRRATLEAAILPSAHGAVIEPRADGVDARFEGEDLIVSRALGLITTQTLDGEAEQTDAVEAGVTQDAAGDLSDAGGLYTAAVRREMDELARRVAEENGAEGEETTAHLAYADFLLTHQLAPEALGVLRLAILRNPALESEAPYRLRRAAANVMMNRIAEAQADLAASDLTGDPQAALWRGYAAALAEQWEDARRELERGAGASEQVHPDWRARFQLALAEAALQLGDIPAAEQAAGGAAAMASSSGARLRAELLRARAKVARGQNDAAIALLTELARARDEEVSVQAGLELVRTRRALGQLSAAQAVEPLEAMRFRWRGDALEVAVVAMLGDVYMEQGRWREALEVMQVAASRYGQNPASRRLRVDMVSAFERLFLDGEADSLEPIQALGLFYQFSDLTPVGPSGDRIVRLLAGRLVRVDLLEQAAQLLQHQVDQRLEGFARAQVASDLAAIYLMDDKPEKALTAIASTRVPNIPAALQAERRILEARTLIDMGRFDHAEELVERDASMDAQRVRAEAAWRQRDWTRAAAELNRLVERIDAAAPLDAEGRRIVLRAAIAMTMAGNDVGVQALYRAHAGDMAGTPEADAFEVVASGVNPEGMEIRQLAAAVARTDLLDRFLQSMRARMTQPAQGRQPAQG